MTNRGGHTGTVKPIPVVFHIGPLQVHTYGIGLALTFLFALWYYTKRLRDNGYPYEWVNASFLWIIGGAVVGARIVHVAAQWSSYAGNPIQILEVWHGGLSSYGGLAGGLATGLWLLHRRAPSIPVLRALDLLAPVLMASWALGRLLGPQLMVAGGGHPTTSWVGMYYADQVGKRLPVPLFQAFDSFLVFLCLLAIERWQTRHGGPNGLLLAAMTGLWDITRFYEEYLWLATPGHGQPVEVGSAILAVIGITAAIALAVHQVRHPPAGQGSVLELALVGSGQSEHSSRSGGGEPGDDPPLRTSEPGPEEPLGAPPPAGDPAPGNLRLPDLAGPQGAAT